MRGRRYRALVAVPALVLILAACSSSATTAPAASAPPAPPASIEATAAAPTPVEVASPSSAIIAAPPEITTSGQLRFCTDIVSPPMEFYDESHNPVGVDIEIGTELARRLGVKAVWVQTDFPGIIPALQASNCDAILSQLFDKPARREVVNFIDYVLSSQMILVVAGNPKNIQTLDDLSGLKVAVSNGSTIDALLTDESTKLKAAGKKPIDLLVLPQETDAFQQLQIGLVDAFGTTLETAGYYMKLQPNTFEFAGQPFGSVKAGIAFRKDESALQTALQTAFDQMRADGTYLKILAGWNLQGDAIQ
jgi:polar amino acid transport system substrate-binding protein